MKNIKIELSIEEINAILGLLGQQPYAQVYGLVEKLQAQAAGQLQAAAEPVLSQNGVEKKSA